MTRLILELMVLMEIPSLDGDGDVKRMLQQQREGAEEERQI